MQNIPLQPIYAQSFTVSLGGQTCLITLRSRSTGLYFDLVVAGVTLMTEVLVQPRVLMVSDPALGFIGNIGMIDTQGNDEPEWSGLGSRWILVYFTPADLTPAPSPQVSVSDIPLLVDSSGNFIVTDINNYLVAP